MGCPKSFSRERGGSNTSSYLANCLRMLVHSSEECLRGHEDVEELRRFSNDIFGRFSECFHQSEIWLSVFSYHYVQAVLFSTSRCRWVETAYFRCSQSTRLSPGMIVFQNNYTHVMSDTILSEMLLFGNQGRLRFLHSSVAQKENVRVLLDDLLSQRRVI